MVNQCEICGLVYVDETKNKLHKWICRHHFERLIFTDPIQEDTKRVIRIRKSKKNRQHNGQRKNVKRAKKSYKTYT